MKTDQIMSFLRTVMNFVGGWLVSIGYLDASSMETAVGAVLTVIAALWGWYTHEKVAVPKVVEVVKYVEIPVVKPEPPAPIVNQSPPPSEHNF